MASHLERLLMLRPKDDEPATIEAAIAAIEAQRTACAEERNALLERKKSSLLDITIDQLRAMDAQAEELQLADAQAGELLAQLTARLAARKLETAEATMLRRFDRLHATRAALEARFMPVYAKLVAEFAVFAADQVTLAADIAAFNRDLEKFDPRFKPGMSVPAGKLQKIASGVPEIYVAKTCLPAPGLTEDERYQTPMVHQGEFWTPGVEGLRPSTLRAIQADGEAREQKRREDEAQRAALLETEYVSRDLGPVAARPAGGLSEKIAADLARETGNGTEGEWLHGDLVRG